MEQSRDAKERQEILKGIIRDLHEGHPVESLRGRFRELIRHVEPSEIAQMEQALIEEGMPEGEVKRLCDLHVEVFKESLDAQESAGPPPGHPVHTFMMENRAAEGIMLELDALVTSMGNPPDHGKFESKKEGLEALIDRLSEIHAHYLRKENQLFPLLEAHNISGPSQVMWAIHDDVRWLLKETRNYLSRSQPEETARSTRQLLGVIRDMIYKEEKILYPMCLNTLSESEWIKVKHGEEEIGYAWIEPEQEWRHEARVAEQLPPNEEVTVGMEKWDLSVGSLSKEMLDLMLTHLPVDLTLVEENDRVAYYSQGKERIFPRSPGIIGREVRRCHPPKSVHIVNQILEAFKTGTKDTAEFWIQMGGRFIHVRFLALRSEDGEYKGTLEVSQDVTGIRQLEGEKRLLDWQ